MLYTWPPELVHVIRQFKDFWGLFSRHGLFGVPFDWVVRFIALGVLYLGLRGRLKATLSAGFCAAVLLTTEFAELACTQHFPRIDPPDWGDLMDVVTGVAGIASASLLHRWWRR